MEKRERYSKLIFIFFIIFLIWSLLQFIAPFSLQGNSVEDLSGSVGLHDNKELIENMPFPWNNIYSCGDSMCHQISSRSFFINGNQMPFCSRCTAIWIGVAIGLGFMFFYKIDLDEKLIFLIIIGLVPIGIDGIGQTLKFWESTNFIRLATGLLTGTVCGLAIGYIIDEISKTYILKKNKK